MTTQIAIDEMLLQQAMQVTHAHSAREAVESALYLLIKSRTKPVRESAHDVNDSEILDDDPWSNPDAEFPTVDTGIADLAVNHDHYLYGTPKHT